MPALQDENETRPCHPRGLSGKIKIMGRVKRNVGGHSGRFTLGAMMLCSFFSLGAAAQGQTIGSAASLTPELRAKVDQLSNLQKNFSNTKKMNGPGVQLSLKEVERSKATDRTLIKYRLYAEGLPKDQIYTLFVIQIDGSVVKNLEGITLDSAGQAVCAGREGTCEGDGPNDPIDLVVFAGKSEAIRACF
ncbi:MAG: hypothetical protein ABLT11_08825 [Candidatus Acidiferrum sp.]